MDVREFVRQASVQEGQGYTDRDQTPFVLHPVKTRIEEICEFANKIGYQRLGLVPCSKALPKLKHGMPKVKTFVYGFYSTE